MNNVLFFIDYEGELGLMYHVDGNEDMRKAVVNILEETNQGGDDTMPDRIVDGLDNFCEAKISLGTFYLSGVETL
tara:strand:- start:1356 stop:1580 length:225 start_codon:yes stop_codon:yes gene_type:complete